MLAVYLRIRSRRGALKGTKLRKLVSHDSAHNIEQRGCGGKRDHMIPEGQRYGYNTTCCWALIFLLANFCPSSVWKGLLPIISTYKALGLTVWKRLLPMISTCKALGFRTCFLPWYGARYSFQRSVLRDLVKPVPDRRVSTQNTVITQYEHSMSTV